MVISHIIEMQHKMGVAGAMGYFSIVSILWVFAACSLVGLGWCVLLLMQKGNKRHSTKMELQQIIERLLADREEMTQERIADRHSIRSELEETIQHRMEDFLSCVDQKMQGLCKELTDQLSPLQYNMGVT
jgi:hypothetical protein